MPTFEQGNIVRVPFPYTDSDTRQRRPALIVSDGPVGEDGALLWVVMITSAANRPWADDVQIPDHVEVGLPSPSVIRAVKIATIEVRHAETIGKVAPSTLLAAMHRVSTIIAVVRP
jgi:mRNA-degrading endonuclease toxin of MazEF toxin-antitoxin module